jgi:hypothetical protein
MQIHQCKLMGVVYKAYVLLATLAVPSLAHGFSGLANARFLIRIK